MTSSNQANEILDLLVQIKMNLEFAMIIGDEPWISECRKEWRRAIEELQEAIEGSELFGLSEMVTRAIECKYTMDDLRELLVDEYRGRYVQ